MSVRLVLALVCLIGVCGHPLGSRRSDLPGEADGGVAMDACEADGDCVLVPYFRHQTTEGHCFFAIRRSEQADFERRQQEWDRAYRFDDCTVPSHAACVEGRCAAVVGGAVERPELPPPRPDGQM